MLIWLGFPKRAYGARSLGARTCCDKSRKKLVQYNPDTLKPTVVATFELVDGVVKISPPDAVRVHNMLSSLVANGHRCVRPEHGRVYYDALSRLRGTFYEVFDDGK
jgi:hypothetical protein